VPVTGETMRSIYNSTPRLRPLPANIDQFFACSSSKLTNSGNVFLNFLSQNLVHFRVLMTELPLTFILHRPEITETLSFRDYGFVHQSGSLPALELLFSPLLPSSMQIPVAGLSRQGTPSHSRIYLVISQPVYQRLSQEDQCALQVHESLRYLNVLSRIVGHSLLQTQLSTNAIETLTAKIMKGQNISEEELRPTRLFHVLAKIGIENSRLNPDRSVAESALILDSLHRSEASNASGYQALRALQQNYFPVRSFLENLHENQQQSTTIDLNDYFNSF
ncbi:MAG: hypothetical protein ACK5WZ_13430, partial [Pseudobdellovibrionaceae bacterium]